MADVASALKDAETKMNKAVEVAKDDFATIRTGRAHPSLFNKVMVDYYGTYTALSQLATIQVPEARMALISPFDKGAMASIEKAMRLSPDAFPWLAKRHHAATVAQASAYSCVSTSSMWCTTMRKIS